MNDQQRYISDELSHFVGRNRPKNEQYDLLVEILRSGWLTYPPHSKTYPSGLSADPTRRVGENELFNPKIICFCDIPYWDLGIHIKKYSSFGLAFSKDFIVRKGGCPVHYIPRKSIGIDRKTLEQEFDRMARVSMVALHALHGFKPSDERVRDLLDMWSGSGHDVFDEDDEFHDVLFQIESFLLQHVFSFWKFFDHELKDDHSDNYYFEREWRMARNLNFAIDDVKTVLLPKNFSKKFRNACPDYSGQIILVKD